LVAHTLSHLADFGHDQRLVDQRFQVVIVRVSGGGVGDAYGQATEEKQAKHGVGS
jgi:hypothetical protein